VTPRARQPRAPSSAAGRHDLPRPAQRSVKLARGSDPAADHRITSGDLPQRPIDRIALQLLGSERVRELSRRLRLPVAIDTSGSLSDQIEISIETRRDRTIWPRRMLVGPLATDLLLLDRDAIHGRCANYNDLIGRLRELRRQIAALVRDDQVAKHSALAYAHAELEKLDALILCRQCTRMGQGVVRLHILIDEFALLRAYEDRLAHIVAAHERRTYQRRHWIRA